jgi:polysaccharide export outer membrane protein
MGTRIAHLACLALFVGLVSGCAGSSDDAGLRSALAGGQGSDTVVGAGPAARAAKASNPAASTSANQLTAAATPGSLAYKIGPQDVLEISVFKVPELSRSVQVADSGTVNLALVGDVQAAGRTAQDIERDLVKRLGEKYLQRPQVTVFVKEYNSQRITVEGAVKKPGVFPYRGRATLLQAIAMAEGLDAVSDTNVVVFRTLDGKRAAAKFDIAEIRAGKVNDPSIESGDVVVVATNTFKETFQNVLKALPLAGVFALL